MRGPLAHRRMRRAVEAYLDGELPADAGTEVAHHLAMCWECSTVADTLRLLKHALRRRRDHGMASMPVRRLRRYAETMAAGPPADGPHPL
ncbi:MAG: hypothetical protein NVSMB4_04950 [Acidimicrobiales bacterium]